MGSPFAHPPADPDVVAVEYLDKPSGGAGVAFTSHVLAECGKAPLVVSIDRVPFPARRREFWLSEDSDHLWDENA